MLPLKVAGAFHTEHMAPAVATLEALAATLTVNDPTLPYVSNADGQMVDKGRGNRAQTGRAGLQPGSLGPVHGDVHRTRGHRR